MKLHLWPYVKEAFEIIHIDQPTPWPSRILDASVPAEWVARFDLADQTLKRVHGKSVFECRVPTSELLHELEHKDISLDDDAFGLVCVPVNDCHITIMWACGATALMIEITNQVLEAFFDGELREVFQTGVM